MATPRVNTIDFETKGIEQRPAYPPVPVGVSIQLADDKAPNYFAWGHRGGGNNCTKAQAVARLRDVWRSKDAILCHNASFDYDVATTHMGMPELKWDRLHDTQFLLYLTDPHARELKLKPRAEAVLGLKPNEQDKIKDWVLAHKKEIELEFGRFTPSEFAQHIWLVPVAIAGPYANGDVHRTRRLFNKLYPQVVRDGMLPAYDRERELMPILLENERSGMRVNLELLDADIIQYRNANEQVEAWLRKRLKTKELSFDSDVQVADALERAGIVTNFTPTKTGKRSVSKKNLTPEMFKDQRVAQALGWRNRLQTCMSTFMLPWQRIAEANAGYIHTHWNQVRGQSGGGTRTGRPSTSNPNFLNIPKDWYDKGDGYIHPAFLNVRELPRIREYVLPDKGQLFGHRDFNQQEFRLTAHFEDGSLMRAYNENPTLDMHTYTRDLIVAHTNLNYERRAVKVINFGMLYGQGAASLALMLNRPLSEVRALRKAQQRALPDVKKFNDEIKTLAKDGDPLRTIGGRIYYCEPPVIINGHTQTWEYKMLNYIMQGSAADVTKQAVINYHNHPQREGRFLVTVYDEINSSMPKRFKNEMKVLAECMANTLPLDVPMMSDGKVGPDWGHLEKCA